MCVYVSQAKRDRKGRARRSHRVRTDVVLTALKGKMPMKGLGGGCPLGHTAVTNNKNSNNTHHHQSGHGHSALDLEKPLVGGGRGDEVSVQAYRPTRWWELWNWPQDTKGKRVGASSSSGLTVPAPDSALSPQSRAEVAPESGCGQRWLQLQEGRQLVGGDFCTGVETWS